PHGHVKTGHADHHLQTADCVACIVGVDGGHASFVACIHGLKHVERLGPAALADDDAVGPHSQCVPYQVAGGDLALAFDVGRPGFHPHHMPLLEPQLGGILDRRHALVGGDEYG